ncbi:MAG: PhzF family phenazine biosynthesis protein [Saprospiraceae bacterium]
MRLKIYQVDAFSDKLFGGNPAAVCPLEAWLPDATLQAIALENNLSETAFFIPKGAAFDLRWFTPTIEVDLCGHATLATAHVLFKHLDYPTSVIHFHSRSGLLSVELQDDVYTLNFPSDNLEKIAIPPTLARALSVNIKEVWKGREDYLVIVETEEEVSQLKPHFQLLAEMGGRGVLVSAPGEVVDFVSRCFFPAAGIDEDPVTGSAHTTLMPYWSERLGKKLLHARQLSARGGELTCRLLGDRVAISGKGVTYLEGQIYIPD